MAMQGLVKVERAERYEIEGPGTLRVMPDLPVTVVIANLSRTGCLFRGPRRIATGAVISIGIPGVGARAAQVTRLAADGCGCAFVCPLTAGELRKAVAVADMGDGGAANVVRHLRRSCGEPVEAPAVRPAARLAAIVRGWLWRARPAPLTRAG